MVYTWTDSPFGLLLLVSNGSALTGLFLPESKHQVSIQNNWYQDAKADLLTQAKKELDDYFNGQRIGFTLPLEPQGTQFQQRVWHALTMIPFAATISYKQLAASIGNPTSVRAVGQANGRNPISIIIPCHRVIGADGSLTGYGGGVARKAALLKFERAVADAGAQSFPREQ